MKKIICICLAVLMCFAAGCDKEEPKGEDVVTLYFLDSEKKNMVAEERVVSQDEKDKLMFAVKSLIEGPENENNKRAIPENSKVLGIEVSSGVATVDMSKQFDTGTKMERLWSRYTLINTVCSVEGINKAQILVEGKIINSISTNTPLGAMGKDDIVTDITQVTNDTMIATLYFCDENAMKLISESREVAHKEGEAIEKVIVEELLKGPVNEDLYPTLPQGIKVLSTETKGGVCFVNLSAEFASVGMGGSMEALAVYSIVNTLCGYNDVEKVQILVEGKKVNEFGHLNLSEPLEKNTDILK